MARTIYLFLTLFTLFMAPNISGAIDLDYKIVQSISLGISLFVIFFYGRLDNNFKEMNWLLVLVIFFALFKMYTDRGEGARMASLQVLGAPIMLSAYWQITRGGHIHDGGVEVWSKIFKYIIVFFFCITLIALYERIVGTQVFGWSNTSSTLDYVGSADYRSVSIMGHPLYNALVVTIFISFILVSPLKPLYKFSIWIIGYAAILCFNTRSSIVGNALLLAAYLLYMLFADRKLSAASKFFILFFACIAVALGAYLFFRVGLGGRLLEYGLFDDDSAAVRVDLWRMFDYVNYEKMLWGMPLEEIRMIMYRAGIGIIENFWINILFSLGTVFFIPYVLIYVLLIRRMYKGWNWFNACFSAGAFVLIASTNNSLSSCFFALFFFLICIIVFSPDNFSRILGNKYLVEEAQN